MRKGFLVGLLLAFAAVARGAEDCTPTDSKPQGVLPACLAFNGATADGNSSIIDTYGFKDLSVYIWSAQNPGVTTARVNIWCRAKAGGVTSVWMTCAADVVDPDNSDRSDQAITLDPAYQYLLNISGYAAGDVYAIFTRNNFK